METIPSTLVAEEMKLFSDEIIERGLNIDWMFEGRVDCVLRDKDLLKRMMEAGLCWVLVGVESSSDVELEHYQKNLTVRQVKEAFKLLKEFNLITQAMFIIGARNDSVKSIENKIRLAKELDPDFAVFSPLTPLPGTPLYEEARCKGWLEVVDFSKYDFAHAVMPTKYMTTCEVNEIMVKCYKKFYHPLKLLRGFLSRDREKRAIARYFMRLVGL